MIEHLAGKCELCGHEAVRSQMSRHLARCAPPHDSGGRSDLLIQLRFQNEDAYWLELEARADAALHQVDALLRKTWLECCGHLSAFRFGDRELPMRTTVGSAFFHKGLVFNYDYDFGSTTELEGRVVGGREGSLGRRVVRLLARNLPPPLRCAACDASATVACPFCRSSEDFLYCDAHAAEHGCNDPDTLLPVVNSPRMGVCAYTG
jgi:hypothetical protein